VTPVEFRGDLWRQKTRVPVLSCSVICVILRLAVLVELRLVTDTDRQTDRHRPMAGTAGIARYKGRSGSEDGWLVQGEHGHEDCRRRWETSARRRRQNDVGLGLKHRDCSINKSTLYTIVQMLKCLALLCELCRHHIYQVLLCRSSRTQDVQMWSSSGCCAG